MDIVVCFPLINIWSALSRWCVSHRKKAKQIVETWDKFFNSSQREQRVSFLYLANDILQNSRRKGSEFVNEFWKVLPSALRHVCDNGDEHGKKVVTRLVNPLFVMDWLLVISCLTYTTLGNVEIICWIYLVYHSSLQEVDYIGYK